MWLRFDPAQATRIANALGDTPEGQLFREKVDQDGAEL